MADVLSDSGAEFDRDVGAQSLAPDGRVEPSGDELVKEVLVEHQLKLVRPPLSRRWGPPRHPGLELLQSEQPALRVQPQLVDLPDEMNTGVVAKDRHLPVDQLRLLAVRKDYAITLINPRKTSPIPELFQTYRKIDELDRDHVLSRLSLDLDVVLRLQLSLEVQFASLVGRGIFAFFVGPGEGVMKL